MREHQLRHLIRAVTALTEADDHAETVATDTGQRRRVVTHHASLLDQLADAIEPSGSVAEGGQHTLGSTPSARLDAIDRLLAIEAGAARWVTRLGHPLRATTPANLRVLAAHAYWLDDGDLAALVADARSWVTWARTVTGWDSPPWRPDAPCPVCSERGTLRVRLSARTAVCVGCGICWGSEGIEVLATFVRVWHASQELFAGGSLRRSG